MSLLSFILAIQDLRHAVAAHATTLMALGLSRRFLASECLNIENRNIDVRLLVAYSFRCDMLQPKIQVLVSEREDDDACGTYFLSIKCNIKGTSSVLRRPRSPTIFVSKFTQESHLH